MRTEATLKDAPDATELQDVKGRIDIDHVGFAYEGDHDVLQDVSLHIAPGETDCICPDHLVVVRQR